MSPQMSIISGCREEFHVVQNRDLVPTARQVLPAESISSSPGQVFREATLVDSLRSPESQPPDKLSWSPDPQHKGPCLSLSLIISEFAKSCAPESGQRLSHVFLSPSS